MIEMSRSPESDMWSVRGMGVAEGRARRPRAGGRARAPSAHTEALLLVEDDEAEVMGITSRLSTR